MVVVGCRDISSQRGILGGERRDCSDGAAVTKAKAAAAAAGYASNSSSTSNCYLVP